MHEEINNSFTDCTLLVSSCDAYSDLWTPYFSLLKSCWPDCPFPMALITEGKDPKIAGVDALALGTGLDWSTLLLNAINEVKTPYVLLSLEDFFFRHRVDTVNVLSLLQDMRQNSLKMLRLVKRPGPSIKFDHLRYGGIQNGAAYKVSTQAAFWNTEVLRQLIVPGESAWEFEVNGSIRAADLEGFVSVWKDVLPYRHHVVEKGKWFPWDYKKFSALDIGITSKKRFVMSNVEVCKWLFYKTRGYCYQSLKHICLRNN